MKIEILETSCHTCVGLENNVREALDKANKKAEVIVIDDFNEFMTRDVMSLPALIIDGEIKSSGHIVSVEKITEWIK